MKRKLLTILLSVGEKPYICETCGRRFTQKQNMTSHLTTHRKPKSEKGFRAHFPGDIDDYDTDPASIISNELTFKQAPKASYRAFEQAKQLSTQSIGSGHYVLGDMQSIEIHTADQEVTETNLQHGLGLLSSVARKGESTDVQVDGIVNISENDGNMDQVVEVLIRSSSETDSAGNSYTTLQLGGTNSNQSKIIIDPSTHNITDGDGQEIQLDCNTAAGLSNILQNPDVLAAINNAASTNKFIVIGPVSMFDGCESSTGVISLSSAVTNAADNTNPTFSQEQLARLSAMVQDEECLVVSQVSSQSVNDSISATSSLAAVESYLHGEQPSTSIIKGDEVVNNILSSIRPDGRSGPSGIIQSVASAVRGSNLTICMPPMSQSILTISPSNISIKADSTQRFNRKPQRAKISASEVSSSMGDVDESNLIMQHVDGNELIIDEGDEGHSSMEAESTTQNVDYNISQNINQPGFIDEGAADSSGLIVDIEDESSSSGEPILLLSADENGQPQIIVKMPDGSETIMSDPALAESLIQVPTITNAQMGDNDAEAQPSQSIQISMQELDQSISQSDEVPTQSEHFITQSDSTLQLVTQSTSQHQFVTQSGSPQSFVTQSEATDDYVTQSTQYLSDKNINSEHLPDQSLNSENMPIVSYVDSSNNIEFIPQESEVSESSNTTNEQTPDSSSQAYERLDNNIDSRMSVFMERVSGSNERLELREQVNVEFRDEFSADSSSSNIIHRVSSNSLQDGVCQSTNSNESILLTHCDSENVSSSGS